MQRRPGNNSFELSLTVDHEHDPLADRTNCDGVKISGICGRVSDDQVVKAKASEPRCLAARVAQDPTKAREIA